jgi:hypothetical protein
MVAVLTIIIRDVEHGVRHKRDVVLQRPGGAVGFRCGRESGE